MASSVAEEQVALLLRMGDFEREVPDTMQPLVKKWRDEAEKAFNIITTQQFADDLFKRKETAIKLNILQVTRNHNTVEKHYDRILSAQSCRIYLRERQEVGRVNVPRPAEHTKSFIESITEMPRRIQYENTVAEIGRRYFYVWGLQSFQERINPLVKEERKEYCNKVNDRMMTNPFANLPAYPPVYNNHERATVMIACVKNVLNSYMHADMLASDVFHIECYDLQALDRVESLTVTQRDFLKQLVIYRKLNQRALLPNPQRMKRWSQRNDTLHYMEDELANLKLEHLNFPHELPSAAGFPPYSPSRILADILSLDQVTSTTTDNIIKLFLDRTELCTTIGEVDESFIDVKAGLQGAQLTECDKLQGLVVKNLGNYLSAVRMYFLAVHAWHLNYLLYIRMFRATELIRSIVAARSIVEENPNKQHSRTVMKQGESYKKFVAFLNDPTRTPDTLNGKTEAELVAIAKGIFSHFSQVMDGHDVCGIFYKEVLKVYNTPDIRTPRISDDLIVKEYVVVDPATSSVVTGDIGTDPNASAVTSFYRVGNLVRVFEARNLRITQYRPRLEFRQAPILQPDVLHSEMDDPSVDFLSPVTEIFHYMLKCASDQSFIGLQLQPALKLPFTNNPKLTTAKFHNYDHRNYVHQHQDEHNDATVCRLLTPSVELRISDDQKAKWAALELKFPVVASVVHWNPKGIPIIRSGGSVHTCPPNLFIDPISLRDRKAAPHWMQQFLDKTAPI